LFFAKMRCCDPTRAIISFALASNLRKIVGRPVSLAEVPAMAVRPVSLASRAVAEVLGAYVLIFFGCGAVHVAVLAGALGLAQVALVWGVAIMLAVYVVGGVSGSHINPAITVALAMWGRFPWRDVPAYVLGQLVGAILAAATLFGLFGGFLTAKEQERQVTRGGPGSEITAMCYGEYFPNPGALTSAVYSKDEHNRLNELVSEPVAFGAEFLGTLILALVVFAITDPRNLAAPLGRLAPVFIGLTVTVLICVIAPLTQACFNPARDFGPRLVAYFAGWGAIALPGPRGLGFLTVYILAPGLGALAGGGLHTLWLQHQLPPALEAEDVS
jgi:glycerol uptake facilitator protein